MGTELGNGTLGKITALAVLAILGGSLSGCATLLRGSYNGDGFFPTKTGVNVISNGAHKDAKVEINGKEAAGKLVYDGSQNGSPFYIRRFVLDHATDPIKVSVATTEGIRAVSVARQSEYGWFLVGGLWTFIDLFTGSLHYYDDVVVENAPPK